MSEVSSSGFAIIGCIGYSTSSSSSFGIIKYDDGAFLGLGTDDLSTYIKAISLIQTSC